MPIASKTNSHSQEGCRYCSPAVGGLLPLLEGGANRFSFHTHDLAADNAPWRLDILERGSWGEIFEKAFCPSFEEGRPRRSDNAALPQEIGAAGEVRRSPVPYRLPDRFKNRLDVLMNGSILKSNKFYSQSLQKRGTFGLVLC